jgi:hypothetical protein
MEYRGWRHGVLACQALSGDSKLLTPHDTPFQRKFGLRRMRTAIAIFENQGAAMERGYVDEP